MHEASLVQGLLKIALKTVEEHNAAHPEQRVRRIRSITCELGLISCVEPQTLKGCFEIFARDGMADGAELILRTALPLYGLRTYIRAAQTAFHLPPLRQRRHTLHRRTRSCDDRSGGGAGGEP